MGASRQLAWLCLFLSERIEIPGRGKRGKMLFSGRRGISNHAEASVRHEGDWSVLEYVAVYTVLARRLKNIVCYPGSGSARL